MEINYLITFITVAETGSMTQTSSRCHITQSAVSQQIKALERELNTKLFERRSNEIVLTDNGELFLNQARKIVKCMDDTKVEISANNGSLYGDLRIGVGSFIEPYLRKVAIEFLRRYPDVMLHVQFAQANVLNKMLRNETIDLAFTLNQSYRFEGIESKPCVPFKLSAIMSKKNKFANRDMLTLDELMQCDIVMTDAGERLFQTLQRYTQLDISQLNVRTIVSSASEALLVLDELDYVTFLPSEYTHTSQRLIAKPIESIDMVLTSNAHWLKSVPQKATSRAFMELTNELYNL